MKAGRAERISLGGAEHLDARSFTPNDDDFFLCVYVCYVHSTQYICAYVICCSKGKELKSGKFS